MFLRPSIFLCTVILIPLCACVEPSFGQGIATPAQPGLDDRGLPDPFEVTARLRAVADTAEAAMEEIRALADTEALEQDIYAARQRERELRDAYLAVAASEYVRPDRFARLRDLAILHQQQLDDLNERAFGRLARLSEFRGNWARREQFWMQWRDALQADPQYQLVAPEMAQGLERIRQIQSRIEDVFPEIMALQREIESGREQTRSIIDGVAALREGRREAMLRRDEPFLFSRAFAARLDPQTLADWQPIVAVREAAFRAFLRENAGLIFVHILIALAVVLGARRLRKRIHAEGTWAGMLLYPRATGIFASTALLAHRYAFAPPVWDVLMWTLLAGSIAMLARHLVPSRPMRRMVYFFAAFYPLFLLAEAVQLPVPLFRLALVIVAVLGVVIFAILGLRTRSLQAVPPWKWLALSAAALMWATVLAIEVAGYYLLSRWILHAALSSALVIFVVAFLVAFARGGVKALLKIEATGKLQFLRNVAIPLAEKVVIFFQIVLIAGAVFTLLDIWELVPSPEVAWRSVVSVGFTVAGITITLERVLFAAVVIYFAFLASWLLRTFIQLELSPRWNFDPSVANSIVVLVHYALIAMGILIGLGIMGVHLQNFAIVAGALGIGIGFGLQNIVNNFVSGLILLFERPVRVGDTVVIEGEWGTIKKIGLRSTIVITFDRAEVIVPNADLVSEKVTNWTLSNPVARVIVPVGVAYGSDVARVMKVLTEAAYAHPAVLDDPQPQVLFMAFGDSSLDFELRVWVSEITFRLEVMSALHAKIDARLREEGIEIPFPQRDLHFRSIDKKMRDALPSPSAKTDGDGKTVPDETPGAGGREDAPTGSAPPDDAERKTGSDA